MVNGILGLDGENSSKISGIRYQLLHFKIIRLVKKAMYDQFPSSWKPVGVVQVPTYTKEVPLLTLGRLRRPGQGAQPRQAFARGLTGEEEEEISEEEGVAACGSDVSIDSDFRVNFFVD